MAGGKLNIGEALKQLLSGAHAYIFGVPAIIIGLLWTLYEFQKEFNERVSQTIIYVVRDRRPPHAIISARLHGWAGFLTVCLFYVSVSLVLLWVWKFLFPDQSVESEVKRGVRDLAKARREKHGTSMAMSKIVHQLYDIDRPRWRFTSVDGKYNTAKDWNSEVELDYVIEAGSQITQVWRYTITADNSADPIEGLEDIDFRIEQVNSKPGNEIAYLLYRDEPRRKEIAVFFLPGLNPGESRHLRLRYQWPGMAKDLDTVGHTEFGHQFKTCDPLDRANLCYEYIFDEALKPLTCERMRPHMDGDSLTPINKSGKVGWKYEAKNALVEGRELYFAIKRAER